MSESESYLTFVMMTLEPSVQDVKSQMNSAFGFPCDPHIHFELAVEAFGVICVTVTKTQSFDESPVWLSFNKNCRHPLYCAQKPSEVQGKLISDDILRDFEGFDFTNLSREQDTKYIYSYLMQWLQQILYTVTQFRCPQAVWCFHGLDTQLHELRYRDHTLLSKQIANVGYMHITV